MKNLTTEAEEIKKLCRQVRDLKKFLDRALEEIPNFIDGRYDKFLDRIDRWLVENE